MLTKPEKEIILFVEIVNQLKKNNFPTSYPYETNSGNFLLKFKNKNILLFEFLDGKSPEKYTNKMISQVGNALAILHSLPKIGQEFPKYQMGFESVLNFLKEHENETSPFHNHDFLKFVSHQFIEIQKIQNLKLPQGITHGDLFSDNLIFKEEYLLGIIDFEDLTQMELIFDV
jgi:homoserine kinase type II